MARLEIDEKKYDEYSELKKIREGGGVFISKLLRVQASSALVAIDFLEKCQDGLTTGRSRNEVALKKITSHYDTLSKTHTKLRDSYEKLQEEHFNLLGEYQKLATAYQMILHSSVDFHNAVQNSRQILDATDDSDAGAPRNWQVDRGDEAPEEIQD